jgi:hypothetical protein
MQLVARTSHSRHSGFTFFSQHFQLAFITILFILTAHLSDASAQVLVNGQTFTNGLSIVDAPPPFSQFHAGSNISVAIEVSCFCGSWSTSPFSVNMENMTGWLPMRVLAIPDSISRH